jgi:hypothetical protein
MRTARIGAIERSDLLSPCQSRIVGQDQEELAYEKQECSPSRTATERVAARDCCESSCQLPGHGIRAGLRERTLAAHEPAAGKAA